MSVHRDNRRFRKLAVSVVFSVLLILPSSTFASTDSLLQGLFPSFLSIGFKTTHLLVANVTSSTNNLASLWCSFTSFIGLSVCTNDAPSPVVEVPPKPKTEAPPAKIPPPVPPAPPVTQIITTTPTYVTNEYQTNPTVIIREGSSTQHFDTTAFVTRKLFDKQVESLGDSISDNDDSDSVSTDELTVTGDGTVSGTLDVTGALSSATSLTAPSLDVTTASTSYFFGAGLTDCDADGQTLAWDVSTGTFTCGDDDTALGGGDGVSNWLVVNGALTPSSTVGISIQASSTISRLSITNATTTNQHISSTLSFGGVTGSAWSDFCTSITGSASLCDGSDATGGGGSSISTSSVPTAGNLSYWTSASALSDVATGTLTETATGLEFSATRGLVGGAAILSITSGYEIPTTASTTEWRRAYASTTALSATSPLSYAPTTGVFSIQAGSGSQNGYISSADWNVFNQKVSTTSIDTESELETLLTDVTNVLTNNDLAYVASTSLNVGNWANNRILMASTTASSGFDWVATSTLGFGTGSVTSVALTAPTGLTVSGSPVTTSGTLALTYTAGYEGLLSASSTNWNTFYDTPSNRITAGTGIDWSGNTLNGVYTGGDGLTLTSEDFDCDTASGSVFGCLSTADWTSFNQRVSSSSINSSAELATLVGDGTGSGALVFAGSPTFTGTVILANYDAVNGTTTNASSTNLFATNSTITNLKINALRDSANSLGTNGYVLQTNGSTAQWVATNTLGFGTGSVTSVDMTVPTGFSISGNPITTTGTLALTYGAGYAGVLTASTTNWNTFYDTPSNRITAGAGLSWTGNTLSATGGAGGSIGTSSIPVAGNLSYWTSPSTLSDVATGTLSETATGLEFSATRGLVGGAAILSITAGYSIPLTASTTDWNTAFLNNHVSVTLAGEDYLSLSTQQITANAIDPDNLSASDFGSFSCNGTTCTFDAQTVASSTLNAPNWTDKYVLVASTTAVGGFDWVATSTLGFGTSLSGGTDGYLARWTSASTLSTGLFRDNGTVSGINATTSTSTFLVQGTAGINPFTVASSTGTALVTILQSGNVGIGTSNPWSRLGVSSANISQTWLLVAPGTAAISSAPALAALSPNRVVFLDAFNDELRTYEFNGTTWAQVGSSLAVASVSAPALAALSPNRVAFIDGTNDTLRTYEFNGITWAQAGSGLAVTAFTVPALTALSPNRVAFIDQSNDALRTYEFNGTTWAQVGSDFAVATVGNPALTALSPNRVAFTDQSNSALRTYEFNGTTWAQVGSDLVVAAFSASALAALSPNRVAFIDDTNNELRTYQFSTPLLNIASSEDYPYLSVSDAGYTTAESLSVRTGLTVGQSATTTAGTSSPAFIVNGTSVFSGKVGLGTTSPLAQFTIVDNNTAQSAMLFVVASSAPSSALHFVVHSTGKVGIGSTTPSRLFTVVGDAYFQNNITAASGTITYASTTGLTAANLTATDLYTTRLTLSTTTVGVLVTNSTGNVSASTTIGDSWISDTLTLTNSTGLPISTGVSGLGSNVATFLATPSSANLAAAITDETGTAGSLVFSASPIFTGTATFANAGFTNATTSGSLSIGTSTLQSRLTVWGAGTSATTRLANFVNSASTSLLTIFEDGKVGIGSSTPIATLSITGTTTVTPFLVASSTGTALFTITRTGVASSTYASTTAFTAAVAHINALRDSAGSLGTNGMVLQTSGSAATWVSTSSLNITAALSGGTDGYLARWTSASTLSTGLLRDNGTVAGINATTSTSTFLVRGTAGINPFTVASSTGSTLFTITQDGKVGIGTVAPTAAFHVYNTDNLVPALRVSGNSADPDLRTFNIGIGSSVSTLNAIDNNSGASSIEFQTQSVTRATLDINGLTINGAVDDAAIFLNALTANDYPYMQFKQAGAGKFEVGVSGTDGKFYISQRVGTGNTGAAFTVAPSGLVGIGSTTPGATLSITGTSTINPFTVGSSTGATLFTIQANGNVGVGTTTPTAQLTVHNTLRFSSLGSGGGNLQTDALGNLSVSSDERLKDIEGTFTRGVDALRNIEPISYHWKKSSGLDTQSLYTGFSAQNIQESIPEAVSVDSRGFLTLSDRPILAALVNATKEQQVTLDEILVASSSVVALHKGDTFWSRLTELVNGFVDGVLTLTGIHTKELCISDDDGTTCITRSALLKLVDEDEEGVTDTGASTTPLIPRDEIIIEVVSSTSPAESGAETETETETENTTTNEVVAPQPTVEEDVPTETPIEEVPDTPVEPEVVDADIEPSTVTDSDVTP